MWCLLYIKYQDLSTLSPYQGEQFSVRDKNINIDNQKLLSLLINSNQNITLPSGIVTCKFFILMTAIISNLLNLQNILIQTQNSASFLPQKRVFPRSSLTSSDLVSLIPYPSLNILSRRMFDIKITCYFLAMGIAPPIELLFA